MLKVKSFKVIKNIEVNFGETLESVLEKLNDVEKTVSENKGNTCVELDTEDCISIVFDEYNKCVGFATDDADGQDEIPVGVILVAEDGSEHSFTVGQFANEVTDTIIDVEEEIGDIAEDCYVHYGLHDVNDEVYVAQVTEFHDYSEVALLLREDILKKFPIKFAGKNISELMYKQE